MLNRLLQIGTKMNSFKHPLMVKFVLKFGEAEMAEMAVRDSWYLLQEFFLEPLQQLL